MAINTLRFKKYHERQKQAQTLADQMAQEQKEESDWGSFLSIAAPLAASVLLPGIGGAIMGGLGNLAGGTGALASLLGGVGTAGTAGSGAGLLGALSGTGSGLASTLGGGLLTGAAKGIGQYGISQGIDEFGREVLDKGGDVEDIGVGGGFRGREATEKAKKGLQSIIDESDEGMKRSAIVSGGIQGLETVGSLDAIENLSKKAGERIGQSTPLKSLKEWITPFDEGLGIGEAAGETNLASSVIPKDLEQVKSIADTPLTEMPTPSFNPSLATEGVPSLNLMTGDSTGNFLDNLMQLPDVTQESSILNSFTQYPQELLDYVANNPDMTQEELDELLTIFRG